MDRKYRLTAPLTMYSQQAYEIQDSYEDWDMTPRVVILHSGVQYKVLPFWDEWQDSPSSTEVYISHFIAIGDGIPEDGLDVEIKDISWWRYADEIPLLTMEKQNDTEH